MRVILAPMQGVLDHLMREVLTSVNDYDLCVSEFIRVVDQLLPTKVFYRLCPELLQDGKTRAGTPVRVQLLGQHPEWLAENAVRTIELGSPASISTSAVPPLRSTRARAVRCCSKSPRPSTASSRRCARRCPPICR